MAYLAARLKLGFRSVEPEPEKLEIDSGTTTAEGLEDSQHLTAAQYHRIYRLSSWLCWG